MERVLKIDPEFQNKIPPLTEEEFRQLEENIMDAGEVYEPIAVWNDTIVDGHNRYKIVLMHPGIRWRIRDMKFADKWEAFDWMYRNQLGRRNLTEEQKTFLLGKLYEARKKVVGNKTSQRNADGTFQSDQNERKGEYLETADIIAKEQNVGSATVKRAGHYAKGIDAIREEDSELADSVLKAQTKLSKKDVMNIGTAYPEARKAMIESIKNGEALKKTRPKGETKKINGIVESMTDDTSMAFTINHLTEQIRMNADAFIRSLSNLLMDHNKLSYGHPDKIAKVLDESITNRITQIKETLNNGTQL